MARTKALFEQWYGEDVYKHFMEPIPCYRHDGFEGAGADEETIEEYLFAVRKFRAFLILINKDVDDSKQKTDGKTIRRMLNELLCWLCRATSNLLECGVVPFYIENDNDIDIDIYKKIPMRYYPDWPRHLCSHSDYDDIYLSQKHFRWVFEMAVYRIIRDRCLFSAPFLRNAFSFDDDALQIEDLQERLDALEQKWDMVSNENVPSVISGDGCEAWEKYELEDTAKNNFKAHYLLDIRQALTSEIDDVHKEIQVQR